MDLGDHYWLKKRYFKGPIFNQNRDQFLKKRHREGIIAHLHYGRQLSIILPLRHQGHELLDGCHVDVATVVAGNQNLRDSKIFPFKLHTLNSVHYKISKNAGHFNKGPRQSSMGTRLKPPFWGAAHSYPHLRLSPFTSGFVKFDLVLWNMNFKGIFIFKSRVHSILYIPPNN